MFIRRVAILLFALALPAHSATLFVSQTGDGTTGQSWTTAFITISNAVMASATGDEIWIQGGTYVENLIIDKPLSIIGGFSGTERIEGRSNSDPKRNRTVIDGDFRNSVFSVFAACHIANCSIVQGGGSYGDGGGLFIVNTECTLTNLILENNGGNPSGLVGLGGAIRVDSASCTIESCTMRNNLASAGGGAIASRKSDVVIKKCSLEGNTANLGGAIIFSGSKKYLSISRTHFHGNRHTVSLPSGQGDGSVMMLSLSSRVIVTNCLFEDNGGSEIFLSLSDVQSPEVINCTFDVPDKSWAFVQRIGVGVVPPKLVNCIIRGHSEALYARVTPAELAPIVSYSNIEGGYEGEGNIDADPLWVDASKGDYHLQEGSPCIDSGTEVNLTEDFDGNPCPIGRYDMGAFEFPDLRGDINLDGVVDWNDLFIFQGDWKRVSGP